MAFMFDPISIMGCEVAAGMFKNDLSYFSWVMVRIVHCDSFQIEPKLDVLFHVVVVGIGVTAVVGLATVVAALCNGVAMAAFVNVIALVVVMVDVVVVVVALVVVVFVVVVVVVALVVVVIVVVAVLLVVLWAAKMNTKLVYLCF